MSRDVKVSSPPDDAPDTLLTLASLSLIAEHINQPLFAKDRDLRFVLVNSAFCRLMNRTRQELVGKTRAEVFGPSPDEERNERDAFEQQQQLTSGEYKQVDLSGSELPRAGTSIPLADSNGRVTHVVYILRGDGEQAASAEQLQEELERYAQERTRALRAVQEQLLRKERLMVLGQLAAGLAHQIRNPLGAIANAIALARRQIDPNQAIAMEALEIANEEIWEANRIITDLLDYARIRPAARSDTALDELVREALTMEDLPASIEVISNLDDVTVSVDERQVRDALRNVIRNAKEAMNNSGKLKFSSSVGDEMVELLIKDNGVGVPENHRHLLFEPLVSSKPLGIGLGLPTARALIMNQSGLLECRTSETEGACFVIKLPRKPPVETDNNSDTKDTDDAD